MKIKTATDPPTESAMIRNLVFLTVFFPTVAACDDIAAVYSDSLRSAEWRAAHARWFEKYGLADEMRLAPWRPAAYEKGEVPYVKLRVFRVTDDGAVIQTSLVTVSGKSVFTEFVEDQVTELNQRLNPGDAVTVTGTGNKKMIRTPPRQYTATLSDGRKIRPTINTADRYVAYSDGMLCCGLKHADVFNLPFKQVRPLVANARGKMRYIRYFPGKVPAASRSQLLQSIASAAGVGLQKRDTETDVGYAIRRAGSEATLQLLKSLIQDVEEVRGWTKWPKSDDDAYHARLTLQARKGSALAKLIRSLSLRSSAVRRKDTDVALGGVAMSVPKPLKPIVISHIPAHWDTALRELLTAQIEDGRLLAAFRLTETKDGYPIVNGSIKSERAKSFVEELTRLIPSGEIRGDEGVLRGPIPSVVAEVDFGQQEFALAADRKELRFGVTSQPGEAVDVLERTEQSSESLLFLECDFKPWIRKNGSKYVRNFQQRCESVFIRKYLRSVPPYEALDGYKHKTYESLLDRADAEGDWTLKASLKLSGNSLTLTVRVGADLHSFCSIRKLWLKPILASP